MFKALSNPNRLSIFLRLYACCGPGVACTVENGMTACVGELGRDLGIAPSTISHHVKEIHHAGLIRMQRRGQNVECSIDPEAFDALKEFFNGALVDGLAEGTGRRPRKGDRK